MKIFIFLLAMVMLVGCATHNMVSKYKYYPQTREQLQRINENLKQIKMGMTETEVLELLGPPQWKAHAFGTIYHWTYSSHSLAFSLLVASMNEVSIAFRDGKVIRLPGRNII